MPLDDQEARRLFELYLASRSHQIEWMNRHSTQFEHYLTLIMAILAITLGAGYHFLFSPLHVSWLWWFVVGASVLNTALTIAALRACDRSYQRFLEDVTIAAKLEGVFGYDEHRPSNHQQECNAPQGPDSPAMPFPDDVRLVPDRWIDDRRPHRTATSFRKAKMRGGVNFWVRLTWALLCGANIAVAIAAVMLALGKVLVPAL